MSRVPSVGGFLLATVTSAHWLLAQTPSATTINYNSTEPPPIRLGATTPLTILESRWCQFNRIRAIVLQSSGRLVVANTGNRELCVFGPTGEFLHRLGRQGAGPGEYQAIQGVHRLRADSLLVYDPSLRRVSILDPDGQFVKSIPLSPPSDTLGSVVAVAPLTDGTFLVGYSEFRTGAPRPEAVSFTQRLFRYDTNGKLLGSIGRFFSSEHFIQATPPTMGGVAYWDRAFGRRWSIAPLESGFVAGEGTDFTVTQYGSTGGPVLVHRMDRQPRSVTSAHIATYRQQSREGLRPENVAIEEKRLAEMPYPRTFPTHRRLLTDPVGRIWFELYPIPGEQSPDWIVLAPQTKRVSVITLPARFQLQAVGSTLLCGVERWADSLRQRDK